MTDDDQPTDRPSNQPIQGSLFHGDVDARDSLVVGGDLTVQGVSGSDLNEITRLVLAALRSAKSVAIAGGAGNTTILAVEGQPHVVVSREQGAALARRSAGTIVRRPASRSSTSSPTWATWARRTPTPTCSPCKARASRTP